MCDQETKILADEEKTFVTLNCDICNELLKMRKPEGGVGVMFECTSKDCRQSWIFYREGDGIRSSCTILAHLWPSEMDENGKLFREKYIPARLAEFRFYPTAHFLGGFITEDEMRSTIKKSEELIEKWYEEHPEKPSKKPSKKWWQLWI